MTLRWGGSGRRLCYSNYSTPTGSGTVTGGTVTQTVEESDGSPDLVRAKSHDYSRTGM